MKNAGNVPYPSSREYWRELTDWGTLLIRACLAEEDGAAAAIAKAAGTPENEKAPEDAEKSEDPMLIRLAAARCWEQLEGRSAASATAGIFLPLPYLAAAFGLSTLQAQCLALILLPEADQDFELHYAALEPGGLSGGLALCLITGDSMPQPDARAALAPGGPLWEYCLEEDGYTGRSELFRILRPARRLVDFALAESWDISGVSGLSLRQPAGEEVPEHLWETAGRMAEYLAGAGEERISFLLAGQTGAGRRTLALALAARQGGPLLLADGRYLFEPEGREFRRALVREAILQHCPVCLTGLDDAVEAARTDRQAEAFLAVLLNEAAVSGCSFLVYEGDWSPSQGPRGWQTVPVPLPLPDLEESRALWTALLQRYPLTEPQDPDWLAGRYRLTPGQIKGALEAAAALARWRGLKGIDGDCLAQGCRRQFRHTLGERAQKVEAVFTWEELILPDNSKRLLRSACDQMRYRRQVYGSWGFGAKLNYGAGLSMLFSGPPGTGKTMAAQIVAGELGLELYKVDLSAVVSKYVGETEKNLSEIFREAARSQAVLFFDEADVLFGKRTEVKDAHDKYNNMEAAYLLQKIEEYPGVSVLATNFLQNFDEAFKRRLRFIIEFPFPDAGYRLLLWRSVFPGQTPVEPDVDWDYLAGQFELSGSSIKNVAVNAAFLAARAGTAVGMPQLLTALRRELFKSGKVLVREDFGEYYMLVEEGEYAAL